MGRTFTASRREAIYHWSTRRYSFGPWLRKFYKGAPIFSTRTLLALIYNANHLGRCKGSPRCALRRQSCSEGITTGTAFFQVNKFLSKDQSLIHSVAELGDPFRHMVCSQASQHHGLSYDVPHPAVIAVLPYYSKGNSLVR